MIALNHVQPYSRRTSQQIVTPCYGHVARHCNLEMISTSRYIGVHKDTLYARPVPEYAHVPKTHSKIHVQRDRVDAIASRGGVELRQGQTIHPRIPSLWTLWSNDGGSTNLVVKPGGGNMQVAVVGYGVVCKMRCD